jgi:hypothetical protein
MSQLKLHWGEIIFLSIFFTFLAIYFDIHGERGILTFIINHVIALVIALIVSKIVNIIFKQTYK